MIINPKQLHLPPFISTGWNYVAAIHMDGTTLIITLIKGNSISIPSLPGEIIDNIFSAHAAYLNRETPTETPSSNLTKNLNPFAQALMNDQGSDSSFRFGLSTFDGLGSALQHNQSQSNAPNLPEEILQKIAAISKIVTPEDQAMLPQAEPHCNCMHCQIARAISSGLQPTPTESEPESVVTEAELSFQPWDIHQTGDKMYSVVNRIDSLEKYTVFLGTPVGCTCGKTGCEHILAVLKS